jgi:hypothetical protein
MNFEGLRTGILAGFVDKGLCPLTASAVAVEAFVNNAGQGETCPSVTVVVTRNWRVEQ